MAVPHDTVADRERELVEALLPDDRADDRHDDVLHQAHDEQAERGADDHRDGQVEDVALHDELLEVVEHVLHPSTPSEPVVERRRVGREKRERKDGRAQRLAARRPSDSAAVALR